MWKMSTDENDGIYEGAIVFYICLLCAVFFALIYSLWKLLKVDSPTSLLNEKTNILVKREKKLTKQSGMEQNQHIYIYSYQCTVQCRQLKKLQRLWHCALCVLINTHHTPLYIYLCLHIKYKNW